MDSTKINGIVSAVKRYLQLKIISVVLGGVGDLADQLSDVSTVLSTLLSLFISVDIVASIDIIVWRVLSQRVDLFLSYLSSGLSTLHFSKLTVVHLITLEHDGLIRAWHIWTFNHQINVGLLLQLQIVNMINILPLQVYSYNVLS